MPITETDIRQWSDRHQCRNQLPIFVRKLIRETTPELTSLRFPGNEAVDMRGLDGQVCAESKTIWVPRGRSVWEMGCNLDPASKVNDDYQKRTDQTPKDERETSNFIFVTPRRWPNKEEWLEKRREEGEWAGVYAFDSVDLETWLEEAPATSRWIGELLGIDHSGLLTPSEWWRRWASASKPAITMRMVASRRQNEGQILIRKLHAGEDVIPVLADDRSEAVAFVIAALTEAKALDLLDRMLVVTSGNTVIPSGKNSQLIVVVDLPDGYEPDFGDRRQVSIIRAYPKGRWDVQRPLTLSHVPSEIFRSELQGMGLPDDQAYGLALKTGHSVPVLRRHLSPDPEVRRPVWARSRVSARRLFPYAFVGSWIEQENLDDTAVVQLLGNFADGELQKIRDELLGYDDAPVAKFGNINVAVSQLDALFAVGPYIEKADIERFFQLVPELIGDRDPALDLPKEQWWMANVLGKSRSYSEVLLSSLCDTLCILAVHGQEICG